MVESKLSKGSIFTFTFKYQDADQSTMMNSASEKEFSQHEQGLKPDHYQILVVDDHDANLLVAKGVIQLFGHQVDTVDSGEKCLEALDNKHYDLVFMDCHMPDMDGFETTKKIIEKMGASRPRIVAFTASAMKEDIDKCFASGMDDFLSKPISKSKIENFFKEYRLLAYRIGDVCQILPMDLSASKIDGSESLIDMDEVKENYGAVPDIIPQLVDTLLGEFSELIEEINQAYDNKENDKVVLLVHRLKGALSNFYIKDTSIHLKKAEVLARESKLDESFKVYQEFLEMKEQIIQELENLKLKDIA